MQDIQSTISSPAFAPPEDVSRRVERLGSVSRCDGGSSDDVRGPQPAPSGRLPAPGAPLSVPSDRVCVGAKRPLQQSSTTATVTTWEQVGALSSTKHGLITKAKKKIAGRGSSKGEKKPAASATTGGLSASPSLPPTLPPTHHPTTDGRDSAPGRLSACPPPAHIGRVDPVLSHAAATTITTTSTTSTSTPAAAAAAAATAATAATTTDQSLIPRGRSRQRLPADRDHNGHIVHCALIDWRSHSPADRHLIPSQTPLSAMALKFLGNHSSSASSAVKHFDIRLDNDYIVFRGGENEAASAQLAGSVVLCLTEPLNVSHIQLTLSGIVHMPWSCTSSAHMGGRKAGLKEKTFFEKTWPFMVPSKNKTGIMPPDNYEWPFDTILEGKLPESIEGLKDAWVIYRLKTEICRKRGKDIVARRPLRIVRTLDPSALELAHAMSVDNIWPNKIEYSISVPSKAIVFGSFVRVDFKLIPLLKGLVIGSITTEVREEQELIMDPEWGVSSLTVAQSKAERLIVQDVYTLDPDRDEQVIDEAAEGYQFSRFLELPKTLNRCLQDCNVKGIKVRHKVKFNVQLHNPDGHVSELRANLPIMLYISPNLPINENNDLVDQSPQAGRAAMENDLAHAAPPVYGEHLLDKLYSDLDPSGYMTPGVVWTPATSTSTPGSPYLQSRQQSHENLRSLDAMASGDSRSGQSSPNPAFVSPVALQHRLQNLHLGNQARLSHLSADDTDSLGPVVGEESDHRSDPHTPNEDDPVDTHIGHHGQTRTNSSAASRRPSGEDDGYASGARTPFPQFAHMEDLSRVPSYTTAVKSITLRRQEDDRSPILPTYGAAVTVPTPAAALPAEPQVAHLRGGVNASSSRDPSTPNTALSTSSTSSGRPARHQSLPQVQQHQQHRSNLLFDEERRVQILQARGR